MGVLDGAAGDGRESSVDATELTPVYTRVGVLGLLLLIGILRSD